MAECSDSDDDEDDLIAPVPISNRFNRTHRYPQLANPAVELPTISSHPSSLISKDDDDLPDLAECSDSEDDEDDPVTSIPISKRFTRTYRYPEEDTDTY